MEYFCDRNLGNKRFPSILREAGLSVHCHCEHFEGAAADTLWLPEVAKRGWIILSRDAMIQRNPLELKTVMESGAALLVVVGASVPTDELARNFVFTLPIIERFLKKNQPPFIAKIYRPHAESKANPHPRRGRVEMMCDRGDWEARTLRG